MPVASEIFAAKQSPADAPAERNCIHCGTPFRPSARQQDFCCAGCQFVHGLIARNGLSQFYDLQDGALPPVKSSVFQPRDLDWLSELARIANGQLTLDLQGLSCLGCVWLIEQLFRRRAGALTIQVDAALGRMDIHYLPDDFDAVEFARELHRYGYVVGPPVRGEGKRGDRGLVIRLGFCGALALNAMLFTVPQYLGLAPDAPLMARFYQVALVCGTLSFLVGGSYFIRRAWQSLRHGMLHIDLPISLGLISVYAGSIYAFFARAEAFLYFDFISTFTFLMLVGRWTQQTAIERNRNRLLDQRDEPFHVLKLPEREKCFAKELQTGQQFELAPGQVVPVRSKLLSEGASFGMEWINGESETRSARIGRLVPSGAILCSHASVKCEAMEDWADSLLSKLVAPLTRTTDGNRKADRFIRIYLTAVLVLATAGFAAWLATGHPILAALQVFVSVLVVSCPCASGVALPLADELAVAELRKAGVFVREPSLWGRLMRVRTIVFDKTGTLTLETMTPRNPEAMESLDDHDKRVLLRMVQDNLHPASCCLREYLMAAGIEPATVCGELAETVGFGLELVEQGSIWRVGRPAWALGGGNDWSREGDQTNVPDDAGHLGECVFSRNGTLLASFGFCEQVRPDAAFEMRRLQAAGHRIAILSGDRSHKVARMAVELGLDPAQAIGEVTPAEKADWLRTCGAASTLMIGDGANDSLAFNESLCTGTPAIDRGVLERKADFYFLGRGLSGVRMLFEVAKRRAAAIHRVLAFTITYNIVVVTIALTGHMSPLAAAVLMPVSSLISLGIVLLSRPRGTKAARAPRPTY